LNNSKEESLVNLAVMYLRQKGIPSDMNEHMDTLFRLGLTCKHVTELGTRRGVSTTALLTAQPQELHCYDLERYPEIDELEANCGNTRFVFHKQDTLACVVDPTDLILFDTAHNYDQLSAELARHGDMVNKYIVFHDTEAFGLISEYGKLGIWPAISEWVRKRPEWLLLQHYSNCNGLTIFGRLG
jgi:hypothetical protein